MLSNPQSDLLGAFEVEVQKAKRQLDAVYIDVENLRREKSILENDTARIHKHFEYLTEISNKKQEEITKKEDNIKGLDSQISVRESEVNKLQKEESDIKDSLNSKRDEISKINDDIKKERELLSEEKRETENHLKLANEKHILVHDKLEKITRLIESIK